MQIRPNFVKSLFQSVIMFPGREREVLGEQSSSCAASSFSQNTQCDNGSDCKSRLQLYHEKPPQSLFKDGILRNN